MGNNGTPSHDTRGMMHVRWSWLELGRYRGAVVFPSFRLEVVLIEGQTHAFWRSAGGKAVALVRVGTA
jgi:hypothetical protein